MHAAVVRAAGDRAFCAGLDTKKPYGQPDDVWNHEDPGELLSPKWQKVWKPVVCAVQGMCTARGVLLPERGRHRHLLDRRDVLRLPRHLRAWSPRSSRSGLMRRVGLAETLRIALIGQRRAGDAPRRRCASAWSPRSSTAAALWDRATRSPPASPPGRVPPPQGTVRAIWESLDRPYRAAMEQGLIYTRLGNPHRHGRGGRTQPPAADSRRAEAPVTPPRRRAAGPDRDVLAVDPARRRPRVRGVLAHVGRAGGHGGAGGRAGRAARAPRSGVLLRNRPASVGLLLGVLRAGGCVVTINPGRAGTAPARTSPRSTCPCSPAIRPTCRPRARRRRATTAAAGDLGAPFVVADRAERASAPTTAPRAPRCGCSPAGRRARRSGSTSPTGRSSGCWSGPSTTSRTATPTSGCAAAWPSSTRRSSTSAGSSGSCSASVTAGRSACSSASRVDGLGRRRAPPPPGDRQPRARGAAHGARGRPRPRRPRQRPLGRLGHRPARSRRRRRLHRQVRHPGARHVRGHRVRRERRRLEHSNTSCCLRDSFVVLLGPPLWTTIPQHDIKHALKTSRRLQRDRIASTE